MILLVKKMMQITLLLPYSCDTTDRKKPEKAQPNSIAIQILNYLIFCISLEEEKKGMEWNYINSWP